MKREMEMATLMDDHERGASHATDRFVSTQPTRLLTGLSLSVCRCVPQIRRGSS